MKHSRTIKKATGSPDVKSEVILVTPELAQEWLSSQADYQRNISPRRVRILANLMRRNEWKVTPTHQIGISPSGQVVDGQHRLSAVIASGAPVKMAVTFNCPESIFDVIDTNVGVRTPAQIAKMAGKKVNSSYQIAALNVLLWDPSNPNSINLSWELQDTLFLLDHYEKELDAIFPNGYSGSSQIRLAAFRGACLRALIAKPEEKQKIVDFIKIVATNNLIEESSIDPRMPLMFNKSYGLLKTADKTERFKAYCLTLSALRHAISGTMIKHEYNFRYVRQKTQPFQILLDQRPQYEKVSDFFSRQSFSRKSDAAA